MDSVRRTQPGEIRVRPGLDAPRSLPRENAATQITGPSLMVRENIAVGHELDDVILELGGVRYRMHYTSALMLTGLLRQHSKSAKRLAGDRSKNLAVFATLTDAEEDYKYGRG